MTASAPRSCPARPACCRVLAVLVGLAALTAPPGTASAAAGGSAGGAGPVSPPPRAIAGVSACALLEHVPGPQDPIRAAPLLARAFADLDRARGDAKRSLAAVARFERALEPLYREARAIFHPAGDAPLDRARAQRFLDRHVFAKDAALRVGREGFEPRGEVATAMALAACRGGDGARAIALGRAATGPDGSPLRAFAALLLLEARRVDEAAELAPTLDDDGFVALWVKAELAEDTDTRRALHAEAARRMVTPDQRTAVLEQARRLALGAP